MRREPLRPICSKIRCRPSGVPGSLPSTSILTPRGLRSTVYVTPFVFQSTSMPVPSFSPHSLQGRGRKQARDEAAGERAVTAELGAPGSPPRCSERTEALPDRLVHQSLGVASARSSPCPLASPLRAETPLPLSSASRPRCPMPRAQRAPDTPRGLLAQASPSIGEGSDRILLILGFFPGAPRTSPSLT